LILGCIILLILSGGGINLSILSGGANLWILGSVNLPILGGGGINLMILGGNANLAVAGSARTATVAAAA